MLLLSFCWGRHRFRGLWIVQKKPPGGSGGSYGKRRLGLGFGEEDVGAEEGGPKKEKRTFGVLPPKKKWNADCGTQDEENCKGECNWYKQQCRGKYKTKKIPQWLWYRCHLDVCFFRASWLVCSPKKFKKVAHSGLSVLFNHCLFGFSYSVAFLPQGPRPPRKPGL